MPMDIIAETIEVGDVGHLGHPGDVCPEEAGGGGEGRVGDHPRGDAHPVGGRGAGIRFGRAQQISHCRRRWIFDTLL